MFYSPVLSGCRSAGPHRLVVFDLDGTVVDSKPVMLAAFRDAYFQVVGTGEVPIDEFLRLLGAPFPTILARLGLPPAMYEVFRAHARRGVHRIALHEEVVAACTAARRLGCRTAIWTGKDRERTFEILDRFAVTTRFDGVVAGDDPGPGKPAPDGILRLCLTLAADPARTVVVGDSVLDIEAGLAAGARTLGCLWGIGNRDELASAGAHALVGSPAALWPTLLGWWQSNAFVERRASQERST
jgi:3-amino-5-hydroxybenzoic acid synthesis related protein